MSVLSIFSFVVGFLMLLQVYYLGVNRILNALCVVGAMVWLYVFGTYAPNYHAAYSVVSIFSFVGLLLILVPILYMILRREPISKSNILDVIILTLGIFSSFVHIYEKSLLLILLWG